MNDDDRLIGRIVGSYSIGRLKGYRRLRREAILKPAYVIETTKGRYFSKQYRHYDYYTRRGLWLLGYLEKKGYPSVRILKTRKARYYIVFKGKVYALLRYENLPKTKRSLSNQEAYSYGAALGRLHRLTHGIGMSTHDDFHNYITKLFRKYYYLYGRAPTDVKKVLVYLKTCMRTMKAPPWVPKAYTHTEFNLEHVFFRSGRVWRVVDFEDYYRDCMFYDIGVPMVSMMDKGLGFGKLRIYLRGYESERKLMAWEKEHLFEAALSGAFRRVAWGMENISTWGWNDEGLRVAKKLIGMGREHFTKALAGS